MIYRIALVAFLGALSYLTVSAVVSENSVKTVKIQKFDPTPPFSGGAGNGGLGDRTGSPISSGSCADCHGGGGFSPSISIQVLNGPTPVTSYVPGTTYTVRYTVTGGAPRYGFQGVALRTNNTAGGTFNTPGANTQVVTIGGIPYVEQTSAVATTGIFTSQWTAPAAGAGNIRFYGRGLAANGTGATNGDNASASVNILLTEVIPTTINYPTNPFCANEPNQTPVQTGTLGGTFSAPAGLSINSTTGVINVGASGAGTYLVTYTYGTGSTTTFNVTINPTASSSVAQTICSNDTYTFGSQVLDGSDAGVHTAVFPASNGCDSTVTLTLSVIPAPTSSQSATICSNETFLFNGQTLDASDAGLNTAILTAANGCDSIVELNLNVLPPILTSISESICENETFVFNGQVLDLSNEGLNTATYTAANGCDSVVELTLNVILNSITDVSATICETGTFNFNGQILNASNAGLNTAFLQSVDGCDSIVNLTLNVQNIDESVAVLGEVLVTNENTVGATFQWVDCDDNNAPIPGATDEDFVPVISGNYAVVITLNGCSETSACQNILVGGIDELSSNNSFIYPNPVIDLFEIKQKEGFGDISSITLLDSKGKVVQVISPTDQFTDISRLEAGVYFLKIVHASGESMLSLVKK